MDIALMPHVKNQPVPAGVEDPVDGHRDLHRTQIGSQMAPRPGHAVNQKGPQTGAQGLRFLVA